MSGAPSIDSPTPTSMPNLKKHTLYPVHVGFNISGANRTHLALTFVWVVIVTGQVICTTDIHSNVNRYLVQFCFKIYQCCYDMKLLIGWIYAKSILFNNNLAKFWNRIALIEGLYNNMKNKYFLQDLGNHRLTKDICHVKIDKTKMKAQMYPRNYTRTYFR
jgi:hypothetical protein